MIKRVAIYVRVSTEMQAEKASPQMQEKDCREYCKARGYRVITVYADTEKYRVRNRLVEPSGTRADRPKLRQMLADGAAGQFDLIVAWREDRLYRGIRPMIDVLDCIEQNRLDIELAKETFDRRMAPIKASIAKMELDGMKERHAMGKAAKLLQGMVHPGTLPYGYKASVDRRAEIHEVEAKWIRLIYSLYIDGASMNEIRRRLIANGAQQRGATTFGKGKLSVPWAKGVIEKILTNPVYHTGNRPTKSRGQTFDIAMPVIIDPLTARRVQERRQINKSNPARHVKYDYLAQGLIYCHSCQTKAQAKTRVRKVAHRHYLCQYYDNGVHLGGRGECFGSIGAVKCDAELWERVWEMISDDALFELRVQEKLENLRAVEHDASTTVQRLQAQLDELTMQEQVIITKWRKGGMSEEAMDMQVAAINFERAGYRKELEEKSLLIGNRAENLLRFANEYRGRLRKGGAFLNCKPTTPEIAHKQFMIRREIVEAIVTRIEVMPDKSLDVHFLFDLSEAAHEGNQYNSQLREFVGGSSLEHFRLWGMPNGRFA